MNESLNKRIKKIEAEMEQFEVSVKYLKKYQKKLEDSLSQIEKISKLIKDVQVSKDTLSGILDKTEKIYGSIQVLEPHKFVKELKQVVDSVKSLDTANFLQTLNDQVKEDSTHVSEKVIKLHDEIKGLLNGVDELIDNSFSKYKKAHQDLLEKVQQLKLNENDLIDKIGETKNFFRDEFNKLEGLVIEFEKNVDKKFKYIEKKRIEDFGSLNQKLKDDSEVFKNEITKLQKIIIICFSVLGYIFWSMLSG